MAECGMEFLPAMPFADLTENVPVAVTIGGVAMLVCLISSEVFAALDRCPHASSDLASGRVRQGKIICPLHGARFDLATGSCIGGAYPALQVFRTRVRDGIVEIGSYAFQGMKRQDGGGMEPRSAAPQRSGEEAS